mmetsp:Transcript_34758/g.39929  ORF Transcript_34758/g.39929 Transcript_34758/m.39929 type:complete len:138 (-) Transcript_34758:1075-1488(-)
MPTYNLETVMGIRAPTDRHCPLEVPDPDQGMTPGERRYEMYLNRKGAVATTEPQHPSMRGSPTADEVKRRGGEPIAMCTSSNLVCRKGTITTTTSTNTSISTRRNTRRARDNTDTDTDNTTTLPATFEFQSRRSRIC